ncbi:prepilin-type N-terminal cleavage/methylation domain-containing protein [Candidatus Sumerlaeota bacterium]|nr:prepilin-type N-terminal cleavage/methylation domain-containing protein [Candidatus Sumerlaeota bacterium]
MKQSRGVTLTELLVVLVIIGLLSTIVVPVYVSKRQEAKVRTAQHETRELALAMETCAVLNGFYVPLQVLDDIRQEDEGAAVVAVPPADSLDNEFPTGLLLIDPFIPASVQISAGQLRINDMTNPRVSEFVNKWQGPFVNFHRIYRNPIDPTIVTRADVRRDFPMDPWGQPYRFFSPIGPIGSDALELDLTMMNSDGFSDGVLRNLGSAYDPVDRYAIISFGPNGVLDLPSEVYNDDIVYEFGYVADLTQYVRYFK